MMQNTTDTILSDQVWVYMEIDYLGLLWFTETLKQQHSFYRISDTLQLHAFIPEAYASLILIIINYCTEKKKNLN